MKREVKVSILAVLTALGVSVPLFAHHGSAVSYDQNKAVKITGTVKDFLWRNPHSALFVDGKDKAGNAVTWSIEMGSPATLVKLGYTRNTLKAGDHVELEIHPSFTNPSSGEALSRGLVINGKELRSSGSEGN